MAKIIISNDRRKRIEGYVAMLNRLSGMERGVAYIEYGNRYAKVSVGNTVHTFIDLRNGDILKAASYKSPAKNGVRGNIYADDFGRSVVNKYGANYLK